MARYRNINTGDVQEASGPVAKFLENKGTWEKVTGAAAPVAAPAPSPQPVDPPAAPTADGKPATGAAKNKEN